MFPSDTPFETKVTLENESVSTSEDEIFRILFLGDWSGRDRHLNQTDLSQIHPIFIDRDNFDDVLKKFNIRLDLIFEDGDANTISLHLSELDGFHPDQIFQKIPVFFELRELRQKLLNPDSFESAAREVRSWYKSDDISESENTENTELGEAKQEIPVNLLDQILSKTSETLPASTTQPVASSELSTFIRAIVHPHLVKTDESEQTKLLASVDEVTSNLMRKILHHPHFQSLESAWRGLYFLVKRAETDIDLKIYLFDISKDELSGNLKSVSDLSDSVFYKKIVDESYQNFGGDSWSVICANYNFYLNVDDAAALIRIGKISTTVNAPFISHIKPTMFDMPSIDESSGFSEWQIKPDSAESRLWEAIRNSPDASHLGLVIPRFLVRLPFGVETDPTETFAFEELINFKEHKNFLWTNPSFICALLFAKSFRSFGWEMGNSLITKIDGLPVYFYQEGDETKTIPCSEIIFTETAYHNILENGLMPLMTFRNSDTVTLARFQSIAFPLCSLKAKWSS